MLELRTGLNAPKDFIEQVFAIDVMTYSPELCGDIENMYKRYERCKDTFLLLYDDDYLAGYVCFLPIGASLYTQLNDPQDRAMRDDDISPKEMSSWRRGALNHLFILSVVIQPDYRDGKAIRILTDGLLDYLREKEREGYLIGSIAGSAVSEGGVNFVRRLHATYLKELDGGYLYYVANREQVKELLQNGLALQKDL